MSNTGRWLLALIALVISVPCFSDAPPDILGHYTCEGYDAFYDLKYSGPLMIKKVGNYYNFDWNFGESGGRFSGTALYSAKDAILAVMFSNPDDTKETGVGIYKVNPNGSLSGNWLYEYRDKVSNELCTRTDK